jgi:SAM-dependent methyltransferase
MEWIKEFYTRTGEWFGDTGIQDHHRARVAKLERLCGPEPKRVLDLGAGSGGTAAVMADRGHTVVAVELSPIRAAHARDLSREPRPGSLTVIEGDYFAMDIPGRFDVVCHWDSFGMGTDTQQRRLLRRTAASWLAPRGCVLMDVFTPWPWLREAGKTEHVAAASATRRGDFDPVGSRFIDRWWKDGDEANCVTESIRCYAPADLRLLLEGTGLKIGLIEVGDAPFDPASDTGDMRSPLWDARSYFVQLAQA